MDEKPKRRYISDRASNNLNEAYARLAIAIVEQACKDANGYYSSGYGDKWDKDTRRQYQIAEVKRFFYDEYGLFPLCMPHTDGPTFYKQMMHNWQVYGYYTPSDKGWEGFL